jgi:hypothetical protein
MMTRNFLGGAAALGLALFGASSALAAYTAPMTS